VLLKRTDLPIPILQDRGDYEEGKNECSGLRKETYTMGDFVFRVHKTGSVSRHERRCLAGFLWLWKTGRRIPEFSLSFLVDFATEPSVDEMEED
jgi:hypothetical protein